jgi:hypothetical protein
VQLNTIDESGSEFMISPMTPRTNEVMYAAKKGFVIGLSGNGLVSRSRRSKTRRS